MHMNNYKIGSITTALLTAVDMIKFGKKLLKIPASSFPPNGCCISGMILVYSAWMNNGGTMP